MGGTGYEADLQRGRRGIPEVVYAMPDLQEVDDMEGGSVTLLLSALHKTLLTLTADATRAAAAFTSSPTPGILLSGR